MLEKAEIGFVLKNHLPSKQKVSIFCADMGKIELIIQKSAKCSQLCPGMIVSFFYKLLPNRGYFSDNVKVIDPCFLQNYQDMIWMHHVLETFYYFVPLESRSYELFNHITFCRTLLEKQFLFGEEAEIVKKLFILRFFVLTGFFPSTERIKFDGLESLKLLDIDFENKQKVEFLSELAKKFSEKQLKELAQWIIGCLKRHPCFGEFKAFKLYGY